MKDDHKDQPIAPSLRRARAPLMSLEQEGRLYVGHLMFLFQCSHQTVYAKIARGDLPRRDGRDGRRQYWLTSSLLPLFTIEPAIAKPRSGARKSCAAVECRCAASRRNARNAP